MRRLYTFLLAPGANCVDIGAHGGYELREMLRAAPLGQHVAFEPLPHLAARIRHLHPGVDVREVALSDETGQADFIHVRTAPANSGLHRRSYPGHVQDDDLETITVEVTTLDRSLPADYVPALVKIDVEGSEHRVLSGATSVLRRHRPVVVFEFGAAAREQGTEPVDTYDLLVDELGYRIFDLDGDGPYRRGEFAHGGRLTQHVNWLARP